MVCMFPSQRLWLMPNHSSRCLTVLSPLLTAVFGSQPFPLRLLSSRLLQTLFRSLHIPWNRLLPTHTTRAYLHYKPNHPAYNIAATLHCLVLSRMQKGAGGSARQEVLSLSMAGPHCRPCQATAQPSRTSSTVRGCSATTTPQSFTSICSLQIIKSLLLWEILDWSVFLFKHIWPIPVKDENGLYMLGNILMDLPHAVCKCV